MVNDESLESITDLFLLPVAYLNRWKLPGADELEDHLVRIRKVFGANLLSQLHRCFLIFSLATARFPDNEHSQKLLFIKS